MVAMQTINQPAPASAGNTDQKAFGSFLRVDMKLKNKAENEAAIVAIR